MVRVRVVKEGDEYILIRTDGVECEWRAYSLLDATKKMSLEVKSRDIHIDTTALIPFWREENKRKEEKLHPKKGPP
ncbi:MAG TPA: hypothetical protein VGA53_01525 [Candidatus Paceibacterota bacterium]